MSYNENYRSQVKAIKIDMQRTKIKTAKSPGIPTIYISSADRFCSSWKVESMASDVNLL